MSLTTPDQIRTLQRALYVKAKQEPTRRFHFLYDKVWRADILAHAYALSRANGGAPGVDGETFGHIDEYGVERWLDELREEIRTGGYTAQPVRRVMIPKSRGVGQRPLGIPTIRDRVVQTAATLVLEPIFEADFDEAAYGYRPKRSALDAVQVVHKAIDEGHTEIVDADLSKYFDTIPHSGLLQSVARRIVDRHVLWLIKLWLKAPVEERSGDGKRRMSGGKSSKCGTPQGGVASPLLSVIYMNRFLKHWRLTGRGEAFHAHVISYADDFVILSRGHAKEALAWTKTVMTKLGLTLNEAKTSLRNGRLESFDFLGYTFGPQRYRKDGHWYLGASPSKKSVQRIKTKIGDLLVPGNLGTWPVVSGRLNRLLVGWSAYFSYGTRLQAYRAIDNHVYDCVRHFLVRRHKVQGRGTQRFPYADVFGELGVVHLRRVHLGPPPWVLR